MDHRKPISASMNVWNRPGMNGGKGAGRGALDAFGDKSACSKLGKRLIDVEGRGDVRKLQSYFKCTFHDSLTFPRPSYLVHEWLQGNFVLLMPVLVLLDDYPSMFHLAQRQI